MKLKIRYGLAATAIAWSAGTGGVQAYNVGDYYDVGYGLGGYVTQGSYLDTASAAVQNSTVVTERRVTTVASEAQANLVLSQISSRLNSGAPAGNIVSLLPSTGGNAGACNHRNSVWAGFEYDNMNEKLSGTHWDANLFSFSLGYDYKFSHRFLAGAALTYSHLDGKTHYNRGKIRDDAYGIVPYLAFKAMPCFDIDAMFGYARVNKKRSRTTPSLVSINAGLTGPVTTSSPKSNRYFAALFGNLKHQINRWKLLGRLGYLYTVDDQGAFNETFVGQQAGLDQYGSINTRVNRVSLRLQAGYLATPCAEPYAFLVYLRDFGASQIGGIQGTPGSGGTGLPNPSFNNPNAQRKNNTYGGGLGINTSFNHSWSGALEGSYLQANKFYNLGGWVRLRWVF